LGIGDAYVTFKGGTGTLSEFGMAWGLARLYFGHHKPFILFGDFWREVLAAFEKNMYIRGEELKVYRIAATPENVLKELQNLDGEIGDQVVY
jgi:predicted Rossmann-fold nucleotide-binding protein